jgi:small-conductance mechanosensitive channel
VRAQLLDDGAHEEPEPLVLYKDFGESGIEILFGIWFEKANYLKVKNEVFEAIHSRFKEEDIEIPFPHISLYTGSDTNPFPFTRLE